MVEIKNDFFPFSIPALKVIKYDTYSTLSQSEQDWRR